MQISTNMATCTRNDQTFSGRSTHWRPNLQRTQHTLAQLSLFHFYTFEVYNMSVVYVCRHACTPRCRQFAGMLGGWVEGPMQYMKALAKETEWRAGQGRQRVGLR